MCLFMSVCVYMHAYRVIIEFTNTYAYICIQNHFKHLLSITLLTHDVRQTI